MSEATVNGQSATAFVVTLDTEDTDELQVKERKKKAALRKLEEKRRAIQASKAAAAAAAAALVINVNGDSTERTSTPTLTSELPPEITECTSFLSDSATYLINRMLESDQLEPSSLESEEGGDVGTATHLSHQPTDDPEDSGVCEDSRSETGTYTLAVDHKNTDVENARQMIDVVFGVPDTSRCHNSSPSGRQPKVTTVPHTAKSQASSCNQDINSDSDMLRELRQRTFTRADSRRSSEDKSSTKQSDPLIKPSLDGKVKSLYNSERIRHDSAGSSRTIEIKAPSVLRKPPVSASNSPLLQRKQFGGKFSSSASSTPRPGSTESLTGSFDSDPSKLIGDTTSPLKLNRAFALRRARLGIETPGVSLVTTEDKQKKNLENRNRISPGNRYGTQAADCTSSNFNRRDGGRFSLRASSSRNSTPVRSTGGGCTGKPPVARCNDSKVKQSPKRNQTTTPVTNVTRNYRTESKSTSLSNQKLSPASSTCSVSQCTSVQRSCSFGPASISSPRASCDYSTQFLRGMSPLRSYKRMFNSKTHQMASDVRQHRQQANVAPIKRSPSDVNYEASSPTPNHVPSSATHKVILSPQSSHMTSSVHEETVAPSPVSTSNQPLGATVNRSGRSLSALDSLVLSAILQLSMKLRNGMKELLHQERLKHPMGSETRMMIDEILPQVASLESLTGQQSIESMVHENLSKDLSSILKNLKRVEQSIEVISLLAALESTTLTNRLTVTLRDSVHQHNDTTNSAHHPHETQINGPSSDVGHKYALEY